MIIKKLDEAPAVELEGYQGVTKRVVLGSADGSAEIALRHFSLGTGGASPYHTHDFPHLVRIEAGTGVIVDADGNEHPLQVGDYIYVADNERHNLRNTGPGPFDFICIVPARGEQPACLTPADDDGQ